MTITLDLKDGTNILEVGFSGTLTRDDYETLLAQVRRMLTTMRTVRLLVSLRRFSGWTAGTLWKDVESSMRPLRDVERLAIVGAEEEQAETDAFSEPFTKAKVRYFAEAQLQLARAWLKK
jgi:hypothetical protein